MSANLIGRRQIIMVRSGSAGYFYIPAGPAAGPALTSGAANAYGSYVELEDSTAAALYIVGFCIDTLPANVGIDYVQFMLGTGPATETPISEIKLGYDGLNAAGAFSYHALPYPIPVGGTTRIAAKVADDIGSLAWNLSLMCIAQADLVAV